MGNKEWGATVHTPAQARHPGAAALRRGARRTCSPSSRPSPPRCAPPSGSTSASRSTSSSASSIWRTSRSPTSARRCCPNLESANCDSSTHLKTTGFSATAALGLMFHPHRTFDIGLNVRGPIVLNTSGTVDATPPPAAQIPIPQDKAEFDTRLPPVVAPRPALQVPRPGRLRARRRRARRHVGRLEAGPKATATTSTFRRSDPSATSTRR